MGELTGGNVVAGLAIAVAVIAVVWARRDRRQLQREALEFRVARLFTAQIARDLRTSTNAIIGLTRILSQRSLPPAEHEILSRIGIAADAQVHSVNDILDITKLEDGTLALLPSQFSLEGLLRELTLSFGAHPKADHVDVLFDVSPNLPADIRCDRQRLRQVLTNLLTWLLHETDQGVVVLKLRSEPYEPDHGRLVFTLARMDQERASPGSGGEGGWSPIDASLTFGGVAEYARHPEVAISDKLVTLLGSRLTTQNRLGTPVGFRFTLKVATGAQSSQWLEQMQGLLAGHRALIIDSHRYRSTLLTDALSKVEIVSQVANDPVAAAALMETPSKADWDLIFVGGRVSGWSFDSVMTNLHGHDLALDKPVVCLCSGNEAGQRRASTEHNARVVELNSPFLPSDIYRSAVLALDATLASADQKENS